MGTTTRTVFLPSYQGRFGKGMKTVIDKKTGTTNSSLLRNNPNVTHLCMQTTRDVSDCCATNYLAAARGTDEATTQVEHEGGRDPFGVGGLSHTTLIQEQPVRMKRFLYSSESSVFQ
ncbi:hypothetical protein JTE90_021992 [Oedothorax gibbosus]|uniref:Uncharacterized protein n=1 Tax=Oedothorax gibbosus TaxID=931172 RepID=A0AAV6U4V8_9ARAC|nr:hypothetical protein JTE90_021992 [Oedothorax gibbosus]